MGGGRSRSSSVADLERLERIAREKLKDGDKPRTVNVFLSFSSEDLDEVNLLRGQAKNPNSGIDFNDWSLREPFDSENAEYIRRGIRERIRQSSVCVVYVSEHTADSKWVDWEIRESQSQGKDVIAVHKGDVPPRRFPEAIDAGNVPVIPWSALSDYIVRRTARQTQ